MRIVLLTPELIGQDIDPDFTDFISAKFKPKDSFRLCIGGWPPETVIKERSHLTNSAWKEPYSTIECRALICLANSRRSLKYLP